MAALGLWADDVVLALHRAIESDGPSVGSGAGAKTPQATYVVNRDQLGKTVIDFVDIANFSFFVYFLASSPENELRNEVGPGRQEDKKQAKRTR